MYLNMGSKSNRKEGQKHLPRFLHDDCLHIGITFHEHGFLHGILWVARKQFTGAQVFFATVPHSHMNQMAPAFM